MDQTGREVAEDKLSGFGQEEKTVVVAVVLVAAATCPRDPRLWAGMTWEHHIVVSVSAERAQSPGHFRT
jgi:hypothetical protein